METRATFFTSLCASTKNGAPRKHTYKSRVLVHLTVHTKSLACTIIMLCRNHVYYPCLKQLVANKSKSRWWFPQFDFQIKLYTWYINKVIIKYVVSRYTGLLLLQVWLFAKWISCSTPFILNHIWSINTCHLFPIIPYSPIVSLFYRKSTLKAPSWRCRYHLKSLLQVKVNTT